MKSYLRNNFLNLALAVAFASLLSLGWMDATAATLGGALIVGNMQQVFPTMDAFKQHMVTQLGQIEVIRQSLYDTVLYPTAGQANLRFFQNPIGQGLSASQGNANAPKGLADTNMQAAGSLPAPQGFWIQSIEVVFTPGSSAAANTFATITPLQTGAVGAVAGAGIVDVNAVMRTGALVLTIGEKPYLQEAPLSRFPGKTRLELGSAISQAGAVADTVYGASVLNAVGRPYILEPGLSLMTSQNFNVQLQWPVAVATPALNGKIQVILDGWLFRGVQ